MHIPSATQFICNAFKLETQSLPAPEDGHCAYCAAKFKKGEDYGGPYVGLRSFMDARSLTNQTPKHVCKHCPAAMAVLPLQYTQRVVVTKNNVFQLLSYEQKAHFLLNPPEPPFYVWQSDAKIQHLSWRAEPTLDKDFIKLRVGNRMFSIQRLLVLEAIEACKAIETHRAESEKRKPDYRKHPFQFLDSELYATSHGVWLPKVRELALQAGLEKEIQLLDTLGYGELWALGPLLQNPNPETPLSPTNWPPQKKEKL
jgi:CRISPR type IV-associated protein Csf1